VRRQFGVTTALLLAGCAGRSRVEESAVESPVRVEPPQRQRELVRLPPLRVETFEFTPFPVEPPIQGATPAARRREVLRLPGALRIERDAVGIAYGIDEKLLDAVALDVGYRMVLGCRIDWTLRRGEVAPEWLGQEEISMGPPWEPTTFTSRAWLEEASATDTIEASIEVFETDIPPQHFWSPTGGQYRVLWRRTLSARVPG
jgi:hypothetical protein